MRMIEGRDVRPDGTVLMHWMWPEGFPVQPEYGPEPPWERQYRELDGEWVTVFWVTDDGWVRQGSMSSLAGGASGS